MQRSMLLFAVMLAAGCTYGGHYVRSGACEGWKTDAEACKRSVVNQTAITRVQVGQTLDQVRAIMGAPERREADATSERWGYLTDYDGERVTTITFVAGKVTAITQAPADE